MSVKEIGRRLHRDPSIISRLYAVYAANRDLKAEARLAEQLLKGAENANAAFLLAGWLASLEGQAGFDDIGKASPFLEGSEIGMALRKPARNRSLAGGMNRITAPRGATKF